MRSKTFILLITAAILSVSSAAMAGSGGMISGHGHMGHFGHHFHFGHHIFLRNQALLGGWGWGWPYGDNGYGNTTVVVIPQATPQRQR